MEFTYVKNEYIPHSSHQHNFEKTIECEFEKYIGSYKWNNGNAFTATIDKKYTCGDSEDLVIIFVKHNYDPHPYKIHIPGWKIVR